MKIDYTYTDARHIEGVFRFVRNSKINPTKRIGYLAGFQQALELCGVKFIRDYMRIYAPDGNDFPQEQIDEYNRSRKR